MCVSSEPSVASDWRNVYCKLVRVVVSGIYFKFHLIWLAFLLPDRYIVQGIVYLF